MNETTQTTVVRFKNILPILTGIALAIFVITVESLLTGINLASLRNASFYLFIFY